MERKGGRRGTIDGYILGGMTVKGENREFCKAGEEFTKVSQRENGDRDKRGAKWGWSSFSLRT